VNNFSGLANFPAWRMVWVEPNLPPMRQTRKCPACGSAVVKTRETCPHCEALLAECPRWDDPSRSRSQREDKLRTANSRMRNSGAMVFVAGIIFMSQGGKNAKLLPLGILLIVIGTVVFLWGWKLMQADK